MIVPKSGRGYSVVTVDRHDCIKKIKNILTDHNMFTKVNLKDDILLNLSVKKEKRVAKFLNKKKKKIIGLIAW